MAGSLKVKDLVLHSQTFLSVYRQKINILYQKKKLYQTNRPSLTQNMFGDSVYSFNTLCSPCLFQEMIVLFKYRKKENHNLQRKIMTKLLDLTSNITFFFILVACKSSA